MKNYDHIVVGLGTTGAFTCRTLAQRGKKVLGLDMHAPPHDQGSHHGQSRSIRRAYLEGTSYVPMVLRAWELWRQLEQDNRQQLLYKTGNLTIGPPESPALHGFFKSAEKYQIAHQQLSATETKRNWPTLNLPDHYVAGLEVEAGILRAEKGIKLALLHGTSEGATIHTSELATGWHEYPDKIEVHTTKSTYCSETVLFCADSGNLALLPQLAGQLSCRRVPVRWVTPENPGPFSLGNFPVNFWQVPTESAKEGEDYDEFYSLPILPGDKQLKIAPHNHLAPLTGESQSATIDTKEHEHLQKIIKRYLPSMAKLAPIHQLCRYTLTPDGNFMLGKVPGHQRAFCSVLGGHGFKFAPVLGEIFADLLCNQSPEFDLSLFDPTRF